VRGFGFFMVKAYGWAFSSPLRKIYYNITTTGLSVAIALLIGTIELLQVLGGELSLHGRFFNALAALNFESLGYAIVALFVVGWALFGFDLEISSHGRTLGCVGVSPISGAWTQRKAERNFQQHTHRIAAAVYPDRNNLGNSRFDALALDNAGA
jgi:high-affinity nickel-transport protein